MFHESRDNIYQSAPNPVHLPTAEPLVKDVLLQRLHIFHAVFLHGYECVRLVLLVGRVFLSLESASFQKPTLFGVGSAGRKTKSYPLLHPKIPFGMAAVLVPKKYQQLPLEWRIALHLLPLRSADSPWISTFSGAYPLE